MENNNNLKWHQKPLGVIIMLLVFWPVGIGLMWKNKIWSEKTRIIITGIILVAFIASLVIRNMPASSSKQKQRNSASISGLVTFSQAKSFMHKRCRTIGQSLMRSKTVHFKGTKLYMFLSVAKNGDVCISSISENELEVLAADCGSSEIKIEEWNAL